MSTKKRLKKKNQKLLKESREIVIIQGERYLATVEFKRAFRKMKKA